MPRRNFYAGSQNGVVTYARDESDDGNRVTIPQVDPHIYAIVVMMLAVAVRASRGSFA